MLSLWRCIFRSRIICRIWQMPMEISLGWLVLGLPSYMGLIIAQSKDANITNQFNGMQHGFFRGSPTQPRGQQKWFHEWQVHPWSLTWKLKISPWTKEIPCGKSSFAGSMLNFGGVNLHCFFNIATIPVGCDGLTAFCPMNRHKDDQTHCLLWRFVSSKQRFRFHRTVKWSFLVRWYCANMFRNSYHQGPFFLGAKFRSQENLRLWKLT